MIKKAVFIICLLITMAFSGPAFGSTYYGYIEWGGTWHDANKTKAGDSSLCWAAAASNILDWAGYYTDTYKNQTEIFSDFTSHWTDKGGFPKYGWEWYLNGVNSSPGGSDFSQPDNLGGGNNWSSVPIQLVPIPAGVYHEEADDPNAMSAVARFLHAGYGVTLAIYTSGGAHTLTCWGYESNDITGAYTGVYVTDSDDGQSDMVRYSVSQHDVGGPWYIGYGTGSWYISEVEALARNSTRVPEPATLLLLGFGLLGLAGLRKKN